MNYIKAPVSTIVIGMAASMAAVLLAAGTKGKRVALPNAEIMIHQPLGGAQGAGNRYSDPGRADTQKQEKDKQDTGRLHGKERGADSRRRGARSLSERR